MEITDDILARVVPLASSYAGVLRLLGLAQHSGSQRRYKARIGALGLDISHFTGQAHGTKGIPCSCADCRKPTSDLGLAAHIAMAHTEAGPKQQAAMHAATRGKPAKNRGVPCSEVTKKKLSAANKGRVVSDSTRSKISSAVKGRTGGVRKGGGRGKKGWYRGFWCDSSWELAFVVYHLDNGLAIKRCTSMRTYVWKGVIRRYYPDFVVAAGVVELKGYSSPQWAAKQQANPDVICLFRKEMAPYLAYVESKYGRDFVSMYEPQQRVDALEASHLGKVVHPETGEGSIP